MPTRITHFLHESIETPDTAPQLGTVFDTNDVHVHDMTGSLPAFVGNGLYRGIVEGIHIKLTSAGTPTKVTIRLCLDADGDETVVPDTEADLVAGLTTATEKCAAFSVGLPIFQVSNTTKRNLYLFAKVDSGTADFEQSCITWRE